MNSIYIASFIFSISYLHGAYQPTKKLRLDNASSSNKVNDPRYAALKASDSKALKKLLAQDPSTDLYKPIGKHGSTLRMAIRNSNRDSCAVLLEHLDPNNPALLPKDNYSVLHDAVLQAMLDDDVSILKLLIPKMQKHTINMQNSDRHTPLMLATILFTKTKKPSNALSLLLNADADFLTIQDKNGLTALGLAQYLLREARHYNLGSYWSLESIQYRKAVVQVFEKRILNVFDQVPGLASIPSPVLSLAIEHID